MQRGAERQAAHLRSPRRAGAGWEDAPARAALAELTLRYFRSRGPATIKDYAKWSSLTMSQVRAGVDMVETELDRLEVDGRSYLLPRDGMAPPAVAQPRVDLVQGYDECVMSYGESRDVLLSLLADRPATARRSSMPFSSTGG